MQNMERGENGGVVLDGDDSGMPAGEEGDAALTPIEKDNDTEPEPSGTADPKRGAEDTEVGEDDKNEESEVPENGEIPRPKNDDRLSLVEKTLQEIREKVSAEKPVEAKPLSDEEWGKLETQHGIPRSAIELMTNQSVKVVNKLTEYIDSKLAKLEFGTALEDFSKEPGFQDAARYKKDIQEFLSDYDAKHWTNPALLKKAVFYARGINANANLTKVRTDNERNKKIALSSRPSSPSGATRRQAMPALTADQKQVAEMMGGESEYNKYRSKGRVTIE